MNLRPPGFVKKMTCQNALAILFCNQRGCIGFDVDMEAVAAGRGAAGLVKSGKKVIANNDYEYAYAA